MTKNNSLFGLDLKKAGVLTIAAFFTIELFMMGRVPVPNIQSSPAAGSSKVVARAAQGAKIYFTPSEIIADTTTAAKTTTQNVAMYINTGGNAIGKIEVHTSFNPGSLQKVAFLPDIPSKVKYTMSQNIDSQKGNIDYTIAYVQDKNNPVVFPTVLRLGTVSFQVSPSSSSQSLSFLSTSAVYPVANSSVASANGNTLQSILDSTTPLTITTTSP